MKKILKIILLLLIFGLLSQNISFAMEDIDTSKITKVQLQKKVIISKIILKKQLGDSKYKKYSELIDKILEKYGNNEKVLNKLDKRLDKLGKKKLKSDIRVLLNFISYKLKYRLFVYNSNKSENIVKNITKEGKVGKKQVVKKSIRRSGGGGGGSRNIINNPISIPEVVIIKKTEPLIRDETIINDFNFIYNGPKVLSLYSGSIYTGSLSIDKNISVSYNITNLPSWFNLNSDTGEYTIIPNELGDSLLDLEITSGSGTKIFNDAIRLSTYPSQENFVASSNAFPITYSTESVTDFLGSITYTSPKFVKNPDGLTWTAIFAYYTGYGDGVQVISVDLSTGLTMSSETTLFKKETWHMFQPVSGPGNLSFVNIAGLGTIKIHSYDSATGIWEHNVSGTYEEHRTTGQSAKITVGTNGMVYSFARASNNEDLTVLEYDPATKISKLYNPIPAEGKNVVAIAVDDKFIYTLSHPYGERILTAYNMLTDEQTVLKRANSMNLIQKKHGVILLEGKMTYSWLHEGQIKKPDVDLNTNIPWGFDDTDLYKPSEVFDTPVNKIDSYDTKAMIPTEGTTGKFWFIDKNNDVDKYVSVDIPNIIKRSGGMSTINVLENGKILLSTSGYNGYNIFDPSDNSQVKYITPISRISNYAVCNKGGVAYITGYFGGALLKYDINKPWTNTITDSYNPNQPAVFDNPYYLGALGNKANFGKAYACAIGNDGRVYLGGEKVRSGDGGGVASYDPSVDTNTDYNVLPSDSSLVNYIEGFEDANVHGIVSMGDKIVVSSHSDLLGKTILLTVIDTKTQKIVKTIRPTTDIIKNSGKLLADIDSTSNMVYLYTNTDDKLNIRFIKINIETSEVVWSKQYPITPWESDWFMADDSFIYATLLKKIVRIDPVTGNMKTIKSYIGGLGRMAAIGDTIYHLTYKELKKMTGFKVQYSDFE